MGKTWVAGEEMTAAKLNMLNQGTEDFINGALGQIEHNILELYLENYFASKQTPYQGLFFDGFSDSNKAIASGSGLVEVATSGQNSIKLQVESEYDTFTIGNIISIFDATKIEEKTITNKTKTVTSTYSETTPSDPNGWVYSELDPYGTVSDGGVVSGKRNITLPIDGNADIYGRITKSITGLTIGRTYVFSFKVNVSNPWVGSEHRIKLRIDGVEQYSVQVINDTFTYIISKSIRATATSVSFAIEATGMNISSSSGTNVFSIYDTAITLNDLVLTLNSNLANTYDFGSGVKTSNVTFDTGSKKIKSLASPFDPKKYFYNSKLQQFQQSMSSAKLWLVRSFTARFNPTATLAQNATQVTLNAAYGKFAIGDTIDIYNTLNTTRERKTISNITGNPNITITFTPAIAKVGGFATTDYVERVDVKPQMSIVASGGATSFADLTYEKTTLDITNSEAEDEYSYSPAQAGNDVRVKLELSRQDTSIEVYAKRLGISLIV